MKKSSTVTMWQSGGDGGKGDKSNFYKGTASAALPVIIISREEVFASSKFKKFQEM
jgi:hypothetical protein